LFDMVFCEGLISQFSIGTERDALREMMRVTKRDGKVLVSEPNWNCLPHTIYKWLKRRLGIPYEYGYEKSFKSQELIRLFRDLGLSGIESCGFYPAYGFYRLAYRLAHCARLFKVIGRVVDTIDNEWCSRLFGFQVIVKGNK
jgi:hypothetical protein